MKKMFYMFLLTVLMGTTELQAQMSGDYQSNGTGVTVMLTGATNWLTYNGSAWVAATTAPTKASLVAGNTITIVSADTWSNGSAATVPVGVTLLFQGTGGFFTANTLTINGTYIHASATAPSVVFNGINDATGLGANSTVIYRASANYPTPSPSFGGRTYNNLTFDTDSTTTTEPAFASPGFTSPLTINGTLTIDSWKADFYTSGNTTALNINGSVVLTGTSSYLRVRTTTIAAGQTLTINDGDSLGVAAASALTVNGTLLNQSLKPINFANGATIVVNGTFQHNANGGFIPNTTATYNTGSTILVTGITTAATLVVLPTICGNVTWNCTGQTQSNTFINSTSNAATINGNLTIESTGTGTIYLGAATTARTLTVNGNLIVSGGNISVIRPAANATGIQTCTVNGDVVVSSGIFYVANILKGTTGYTGVGYLNITGNLNHTGGIFGMDSTTTAGTGVLSFTTSNTDKTITTTGISGNISIVINKTASGWVTLNSSLALWPKATLNFTSGSLALASNVVLQTAPTAISGASATSYVVINTSGTSTGLLKMTGITAATVFPVGTSAGYLPVTIAPITTSDFEVGAITNAAAIGVTVTPAQLATIVDAVWLIDRTSSNTDNATVSVNWPTALEGASFASFGNNIGLANYNPTWGWNTFGGTGNSATNTASNTFNVFTAFTVGQIGTSLPVHFVSLNAVAADNNKVNIIWKVENQLNINNYSVEKSNNGLEFNLLTDVTAKGNSAATYTATDNSAFVGANFYRIKAIGKSGEIQYSSIVRVNTVGTTKAGLLVYPNPVVNKTINVQLTGLIEDEYALMLVNNIGQTVYTTQLGRISNNQSLSLPLQSGIASGTYHLVIKSGAQQLNQTILIK